MSLQSISLRHLSERRNRLLDLLSDATTPKLEIAGIHARLDEINQLIAICEKQFAGASRAGPAARAGRKI